MFESSRDILNLVIALSVFLVSFAIAWFIFEVAVIVRRMRKLTDSVQERLEKIDDAIHSIKDKLGSTAASLGFLAEGAKQLIKYVIEKKMERGRSRRKGRRTDEEEPTL